MPTTNGGSKRFELPKLDFKFGSLTDGTDIPPPLPSPVQEVPTPPQTPRASETKDGEPAVKEKVNDKTNGHAPAVPNSPATTNEGESQSNANGAAPHNRPMSRSQGSIRDEKKSKRSSGWFKRLRSSESSPPQNRSSVVYEHSNSSQTQSKPQVQAPPPPMIPELSALEAKVDVTDGGSLGSDLFKNIK